MWIERVPTPADPSGPMPAPADPSGPTPAPAAAVSTTSERGVRVAAILIAFGWHLAINLPAVLANWSAYRAPWLVAAGWLVYLAVGLVAGAGMLAGRRVPAWTLTTALLGVDVLVFLCTPARLLFDSANWAWATLGWFAVLVLWGRRIGTLVTVLAAGAAVALVTMLAADGGDGGDAADLSRYVMYVYGTAILQVALAVGGGLLAGLAGETARAAAAQTAIEAERAAAGRIHLERRERLAALGRTVGALLAGLADGRADPADPAVQRRCALEAARLRRLIAESDDVPDPLLHELRACVDVAERNGLPVEFVTIGTLPPMPVEVRRRLAEPLTATLAAARDWARLTVVAQPDEVVVSLATPGCHPVTGSGAAPATGVTGSTAVTSQEHDVQVEYSYEEDEELVWAQTRWRTR